MAYSTRQQQAVLACLARRQKDYLTASQLAEELREAGCPVGMATIYRQLEKLEALGRIHKVNTEEGALYQYCSLQDGDDRDCFLLKCEGCGRILHLDCTHLAPLYDHLEREHHFTINPHKTLFTGLCEQCLGEKESNHGSK